jgi:hypothetical protein
MKELSRTRWSYSHFDNLKASPSPVSGTAASVGHRDDLDGGVCKSINDRVGKTAHEKLPCAMQVQRPALRAVGNFSDGVIEGRHKSVCGGAIAFGVPLVRSLCFSDSVGVEFNAWTSHGIVQGSGDALRTRERSLLFPYLIHQYVAGFPYSTPLQRPYRPRHLSFRADARPERPVLQPANVAPLRKPSYDSPSCLEIKRHTASRQSLPGVEMNVDNAKLNGTMIRPIVVYRADKVIK